MVDRAGKAGARRYTPKYAGLLGTMRREFCLQ